MRLHPTHLRKKSVCWFKHKEKQPEKGKTNVKVQQQKHVSWFFCVEYGLEPFAHISLSLSAQDLCSLHYYKVLNTTLSCTTLYFTILYCTIPLYTSLHNTVLIHSSLQSTFEVNSLQMKTLMEDWHPGLQSGYMFTLIIYLSTHLSDIDSNWLNFDKLS